MKRGSSGVSRLDQGEVDRHHARRRPRRPGRADGPPRRRPRSAPACRPRRDSGRPCRGSAQAMGGGQHDARAEHDAGAKALALAAARQHHDDMVGEAVAGLAARRPPRRPARSRQASARTSAAAAARRLRRFPIKLSRSPRRAPRWIGGRRAAVYSCAFIAYSGERGKTAAWRVSRRSVLALALGSARSAPARRWRASRRCASRSNRPCLSPSETREEIKSRRLLEPFAVLKSAAAQFKAEALSAKLCRSGDEFVYEIALLHRDGRLCTPSSTR